MAKAGTFWIAGAAFLGGMWTNEQLDSEPAPAPEFQASTLGSFDSVYYENCTDARYHGAAPVYSGDPGYASHLDRDGDGVGCE